MDDLKNRWLDSLVDKHYRFSCKFHEDIGTGTGLLLTVSWINTPIAECFPGVFKKLSHQKGNLWTHRSYTLTGTRQFALVLHMGRTWSDQQEMQLAHESIDQFGSAPQPDALLASATLTSWHDIWREITKHCPIVSWTCNTSAIKRRKVNTVILSDEDGYFLRFSGHF